MQAINPLSHKYLSLTILLYLCLKRYCNDKQLLLISEQRSRQARGKRDKECIQWSELQECISDIHFRRMFRMTRLCFDLLCQKIIAAVGESGFKSEAYIDAFLEGDSFIFDRSKQMHQAQKLTSGGYVSGEIKLAIALCLLAGGSSLDLAVIFDISESHCRQIFLHVTKNWIVQPNIGKIDIESYLKDEARMKKYQKVFQSVVMRF